MTYFDFKPRLRDLGRSLAWLATASGVSRATVYRHQARRSRGFLLATLERFCRALACQPGEILFTAPAKGGRRRRGN